MLDSLPPNVQSYCINHSTSDSELYRQLIADTEAEESAPQMLSGPMVANVLQLLIRLLKARRIIEVGTFTGYATLKMAEVLSEEGIVITLDNQPRDIARRYFKKAPWGKKITLKEGPAVDSLTEITDLIDFAFVDADKQSYPDYYDLCMNLLRSRGMIVFDNALRSGDVLDPQDDGARAIAQTNDRIQADDRVTNMLLPIRDGLMIVHKLSD